MYSPSKSIKSRPSRNTTGNTNDNGGIDPTFGIAAASAMRQLQARPMESTSTTKVRVAGEQRQTIPGLWEDQNLSPPSTSSCADGYTPLPPSEKFKSPILKYGFRERAASEKDDSVHLVPNRTSMASNSWRRDSTAVNSPLDAEFPEGGEATFKNGKRSMCHGRSSDVRRVGVNVDAILRKLEAERRPSESTALLPLSLPNDRSRTAGNSECTAQKQVISASLPVLLAPAAITKSLIREPPPISRKLAARIVSRCTPVSQSAPSLAATTQNTRTVSRISPWSPSPPSASKSLPVQSSLPHISYMDLTHNDLREKDLRHHIAESALDYILTEYIQAEEYYSDAHAHLNGNGPGRSRVSLQGRSSRDELMGYYQREDMRF
ncbi:hypothetical protein SeLEV6574_g05823 [Synchytrium endobioticum]|uniref:Uncharacterized protein n=1 Tax=Synchytrium endobioticum TaxID=286115 RepID=A0A507CS53_9FUNG|nr:hypothetical protein SeLEV6574_g05823 [Synchytrium endobioticum]